MVQTEVELLFYSIQKRKIVPSQCNLFLSILFCSASEKKSFFLDNSASTAAASSQKRL